MENNELMHYGVLGMKWGVRRYRNKNGAITKAGVKKYNKEAESSNKNVSNLKSTKSSKRPISDLSDSELQAKIDRIRLETTYKELISEKSSKDVSKGKEFAKRFLDNMVWPAVEDAGKQLIKSKITKALNDKLKLEDEYKIYTNNKKK